jgi:kynurenine formamidase
MAVEMDRRVPDQLKEWPGHTGNWGRWPNDRGALNLITPEVVRRAFATIRNHEVISCARAVRFIDPLRPGPAGGMRMIPSLYKDGSKYNALGDELTFRTHGIVNTHIDAFSHAGFGGYAFNGMAYSEVITMADGARKLDVTGHGPIITRGILADVPRRRNVSHLAPGEWVVPEDILEAANAARPGDAIVIRTGATIDRGLPPDEKSGHHGTIAGVHWDCLELLAKRDIAVFATDCGADCYPGPADKPAPSPVHILCLVMYGIPLIHNMDLEALAEACAREGRHEFMLIATPLCIPSATGSAVAPVAVL